MSLIRTEDLSYDLSVFKAESLSDDYERAIIGDFDLLMMKKWGYSNLSKVCETAGKSFSNWFQLSSSKEYVKYIESNESGLMVAEDGRRVALHQVF